KSMCIADLICPCANTGDPPIPSRVPPIEQSHRRSAAGLYCPLYHIIYAKFAEIRCLLPHRGWVSGELARTESPRCTALGFAPPFRQQLVDLRLDFPHRRFLGDAVRDAPHARRLPAGM